MLAAIFIQGGIAALTHPRGHAEVAQPALDAVAPAVDKAVEVAPVEERPDDEMLIKIDAGVKIVAGSMLALGRFPRLASLALATSLVPTTYAAHRFWEETDAQRKTEQQLHFFKNVGLLGGLLIAAADTEGKPSLGWRGRRAAKLAATATAAQAASISGAAADVTGRISGSAQEAGGKLSGSGNDGTSTVAGLAAGLAGLAPGAGAAVSRSSKKAEKRSASLQKAADKRTAALQKRAAKRAASVQKAAAKKRAELAEKGPGFVDQVASQASKLGHDMAERASAVGAEVAHQAEGAAKDARKRVAALTH